jgi:CheY-like chemotaxis protein
MMTLKKALVVDDSRSARYSLRKTLERLNMSVECVESGENAISYLEASHTSSRDLPDVIFMDNLMPGLSGLDTTETISQDSRWRHIPVVMCTATQNPNQASEQTLAAGFLPKPATTNQVQALLATLTPATLREDKTENAGKNDTVRHNTGDDPATGNDGTQNSNAKINSVKNDKALKTPAAEKTSTRNPPPTAHQPSLIQGPSTCTQHDLSHDKGSVASEIRQTSTHVSLAPATMPAEPDMPAEPEQATNVLVSEPEVNPITQDTQTSIDGSLDALIDQLQSQLNGIEPRLLSLESAKHTLDTAIHQRLKEMHDQLVTHVHHLIEEVFKKDERPGFDQEAVKTQLAGILDDAVMQKLNPLERQLREALDAQSRHIEHRLMGEVVDTDHVIEQASTIATQAATEQINRLIATQVRDDDNRIKALLTEAEEQFLERATAKEVARRQANTIATREAEKIACRQAEKAVSDNLQRLQKQLSETAQSQINNAVKKQKVMSIAGFGIAIIALSLSVML